MSPADVCVRVSDPPRLVQNDPVRFAGTEGGKSFSRQPRAVSGFCNPYGEKLNPTGSVKGKQMEDGVAFFVCLF